MAHQAESTSRADLASATVRNKKIILLCSEQLRFVARGVEEALIERGWDVRAEYGEQARPWVQQRPVERPSIRVLCVPGTVDADLARQLRTAFGPDPDADLHIVGMDDPGGLVQRIERLAGVRTARRRPLSAAPRLHNPTLVERQVQRARVPAAMMGMAAGLTLMLGTGLAIDRSDSGIRTLSFGTLAVTTGTLTDAPPAQAAPVLAAVAPFDYDDWEPPAVDERADIPEEEPMLAEPSASVSIPVVIPAPADPAAPTSIATPLGAIDEAQAIEVAPAQKVSLPYGFMPVGHVEIEPAELPQGFLPVAGLAVNAPKATLPSGFLPVAGLPVQRRAAVVDSGLLPSRGPTMLPVGFRPVAGLSVAPGLDPVDLDPSTLPVAIGSNPFLSSYAGADDSITMTADPFDWPATPSE